MKLTPEGEAKFREAARILARSDSHLRQRALDGEVLFDEFVSTMDRTAADALRRLNNTTKIVVVRVYEALEFSLSNRGRNIGFWIGLEAALEGLANFGTESRYSYAVLEEMSPGMHPPAHQTLWLKYDDEEGEWKTIPREGDFMLCVNHTIG